MGEDVPECHHDRGPGGVGGSGEGRLARWVSGRRSAGQTRSEHPQEAGPVTEENALTEGPDHTPAAPVGVYPPVKPPPERDYPQSDALHPQDAGDPAGEVSRETAAGGAGRIHRYARRPISPSTYPPFDDDTTPLARAAEHSVLARQGTRFRAAMPRPAGDPGDGRRQPEGRRRQDHLHGERRGRARPAGTARAGHRPGPPGERLDGAQRGAPPRGAVHLRPDRGRRARWPRWSPRARRSTGLWVVPATIDLAGAEIELVSVVARESRLFRALEAAPADRAGRPGRRGALRLRADRLPALAGPADPQRPGGRGGDADPDPGGVLRAGGPRPAPGDRRDGAQAPQPAAGGLDHPGDHVRRPHPTRRRGRRGGAGTLRRPGAADRRSPARCGSRRRRRTARR